jgi:plasmid maintenance system killer protein
MKIHFTNSKYAKLLDDEKKLVKKYGQEQANCILENLQILYNAENILDIPRSLRPHPLEPKSKNLFALDLKHPYRFIIEACGSFMRDDYSTIKEIIFVDIKDYH